MNDVSELRQDPVSHEWVVIATGRARRPDEFKKDHPADKTTPRSSCPFEDPVASGNKVVLTVPADNTDDDWWVKVIENKYPLVEGDRCGVEHVRGPYRIQPGAGHHEVIITRDHERSFAEMTEDEAIKLVEVYRARYRTLAGLDCSRYVLIFHNHGRGAGASISHPHSQIVAIPIVSPDVSRSLEGSRRYRNERGVCVHCEMLYRDRAEGRVVFENGHMAVVSPFVPRNSFELRIYPKEHEPYFEDIDEAQIRDLAEALRVTLGKLFRGLSNVDYNFFVHTAPVHEKELYGHYHWHVEILPKPPTPAAGFEFGTHINVSVVDPDAVADYLRSVLADQRS